MMHVCVCVCVVDGYSQLHVAHGVSQGDSELHLHSLSPGTQPGGLQVTNTSHMLEPSRSADIHVQNRRSLLLISLIVSPCRIFEACEAGSIPIIVLDSSYQLHDCQHEFKPLVDAGRLSVTRHFYIDLSYSS